MLVILSICKRVCKNLWTFKKKNYAVIWLHRFYLSSLLHNARCLSIKSLTYLISFFPSSDCEWTWSSEQVCWRNREERERFVCWCWKWAEDTRYVTSLGKGFPYLFVEWTLFKTSFFWHRWSEWPPCYHIWWNWCHLQGEVLLPLRHHLYSTIFICLQLSHNSIFLKYNMVPDQKLGFQLSYH